MSDQDISLTGILAASFAGGSIMSVNEAHQIPSCLYGGAGTLYYEYVSPTVGVIGQVYAYNKGSKRIAATPITFVPEPTFNFIATNINLRGTSFVLKQGADCDINTVSSTSASSSPSCSTINLLNSTVYCNNQTIYLSLTLHRTLTLLSCGLLADVVSFDSSSLLEVYSSDGFYGTGKGFFLSVDSQIRFGTYALLNFTKMVQLNGAVQQVSSQLYRGQLTPTFRINSVGNVSVQSVQANKVLISGSYVNISDNSRLDLISTANLNLCLTDLNASQTCSFPDTSIYPSLKWIRASNRIQVGRSSNIRAAAIFMCAKTIEFLGGDSSISTDSLGCTASNGTGMGSNGVYGTSGGGGGGFDGYGGYGYNNPNSAGDDYSSTGLLSSGSGGGCSAPSRTSCLQQGFGGGLINIYAPNLLNLNSNISSNGQSGAYCGGGGSGGSISITTNVLKGSGKVRANGGAGGSCSQPGRELLGFLFFYFLI